MSIAINGKVALVTGASRGIGRVITEYLLRSGCTVVGVAKNDDMLNSLSNELKNYKSRLITLQADLSKSEDVNELCNKISSLVGTVDIIVNNAGVFYFEHLSDSTDEMLEESFAVNVYAPFKISRYFSKSMKEQRWGRIINICSSSSYNGGGTPKHCIYSSTKHALLGFSRALDEELRSYNIRVGTVSPAGVSTDMVSGRKDLDKESLMSPETVADAVMYLITSDGLGIVYEMYIHRMLR